MGVTLYTFGSHLGPNEEFWDPNGHFGTLMVVTPSAAIEALLTMKEPLSAAAETLSGAMENPYVAEQWRTL